VSIYRRLNLANPSTLATGIDDRRSVCRYSVVKAQAWLGWWEGNHFQSGAASIVDISLRGAMLTVSELPPSDRSVWFCPPNLSASSPSEWLEARVIEARKRLWGPRRVRILFRKPFPYEGFKAVVYGPDAVGGAQPQLWIPEAVEEDRDEW
jgi:hypothetical protein